MRPQSASTGVLDADHASVLRKLFDDLGHVVHDLVGQDQLGFILHARQAQRILLRPGVRNVNTILKGYKRICFDADETFLT